MSSPPNAMVSIESAHTHPGANLVVGDTASNSPASKAPTTQRTLNTEPDNVNSEAKRTTLPLGLNVDTVQFFHSPPRDRCTWPLRPPKPHAATDENQQCCPQTQISEATRVNSDTFKAVFRNPSTVEDQQAIIKAQIVEILRREATVEIIITAREDDIKKLKNRQTSTEQELQILDLLDDLEEKVTMNAERLN